MVTSDVRYATFQGEQWTLRISEKCAWRTEFILKGYLSDTTLKFLRMHILPEVG